MQVDLPYIEVVSRLKRDNERIAATLVSATAALNKSERDTAKLAKANKGLETAVVLLEQQVKSKGSVEQGVDAAYRQLQVTSRPVAVPCLPTRDENIRPCTRRQ